MADEGLVLAAGAKARLGQALLAAQHTDGHLQGWEWAGGSHQHAPFVERQAPAYAGGVAAGLLATVL
jgi:hypothetical protein